jgi:peptidoglycan hydrolase-like protein with peptidoglycan-binding domain
VVVGSTLVYVTSLPEDDNCQKVQEDGETLYLCDGVLYRATYYQDEQVYEIVSDAEEEAAAEPTSVIGLGLTSPMTRGQVVRDLQNQLVELGYDVGSVDGVFGSATEAAILWVQYDNGLEQTGFVDRATAEVLGYDVPPAPPPTEGSDDGATGATTEEARQTEDDPAVTGDAATDATAAPDTQEESAGEDSGAETGSGSD